MSVQPGPELSDLSTLVLLDRAKQGDGKARDALYRRYLPRLQRWARGRLPSRARGTLETDDLVQETLLKTLARDEPFDPEHSGAFLGYVRRAVSNRIIGRDRSPTKSERSNGALSRKRPLAGSRTQARAHSTASWTARRSSSTKKPSRVSGSWTRQPSLRVSKTASRTTKSPASSENRPQMPPEWQ